MQQRYGWLDARLARRLARAYGARIGQLLGDAASMADLGAEVAPGLHERELRFLQREEWVVSAEDVLWRRSKLGLRYTPQQRRQVADWLDARREIPAMQGREG